MHPYWNILVSYFVFFLLFLLIFNIENRFVQVCVFCSIACRLFYGVYKGKASSIPTLSSLVFAEIQRGDGELSGYQGGTGSNFFFCSYLPEILFQ